jgi:glycosyltransferase involved in cell wall biosynthesis
MEPDNARAPRAEKRVLVVSSAFAESETVQQLGREAYSYRFVYRALAPLLARWGRTLEVTRAESRLDYAIHQASQQGLEPFHLSFLPLHLLHPTSRAPNIAFPFWEFPDIPDSDFGNNPRNNWLRTTGRLALILTACDFTRAAFLRAGVTCPVRVVPVPVRPEYFAVPRWQPGQRIVLDCPCYVFPPPATGPVVERHPWAPPDFAHLSLRQRLRYIYLGYIRPRLPALVDNALTQAVRARRVQREKVQVLHPVTNGLELSGVVYTTVLNPYDFRKNLDDILSAFLLALGDREDATLVLKFVVCPRLAARSLNAIIRHYQHLGIAHRCKVVFVTAYLSDAQMVDLARGSTYYLNASHAEGACLPLQDFLAAGRPGIAPLHTALTDYFGDEVGLVVASHPEPTYWPHDPDQRASTSWHRIVWQDLHNQLGASYELAKQDLGHYQTLADHGRERIQAYASAAQVWPQLNAALNLVADGEARPASALRKAS